MSSGSFGGQASSFITGIWVARERKEISKWLKQFTFDMFQHDNPHPTVFSDEMIPTVLLVSPTSTIEPAEDSLVCCVGSFRDGGNMGVRIAAQYISQ